MKKKLFNLKRIQCEKISTRDISYRKDYEKFLPV